MKKSKYRTFFYTLPFVGGCMALGFLGSFFGGAWKAQQWYDESPKPLLWPPQWVFPLVWIGNYTLLGSALSLVWRSRKKQPIFSTLTAFVLHMLHNIFFISIVNHFKKQSVYVLMDVIGLGSGVITTLLFARIARRAGWIMLPYIGWLFFTTFIKIEWWNIEAQRSTR